MKGQFQIIRGLMRKVHAIDPARVSATHLQVVERLTPQDICRIRDMGTLGVGRTETLSADGLFSQVQVEQVIGLIRTALRPPTDEEMQRLGMSFKDLGNGMYEVSYREFPPRKRP